MFKNLFVFTKQANTTAAKEEEEKNGGNSDLIQMPPNHLLKVSEVPQDNENLPLDFSHNPFATQPQKELSESQLIFTKASHFPGSTTNGVKSQTSFVEIESYEKLRARADKLTETMKQLQSRLSDKDLECQQTEEEVQASSRIICGLKRDIRELVDRIELQQCDIEELSLESQGYQEVNNALH